MAAATTVGFIPLQLIPTNTLNTYSFDKFPGNGTYVVVKAPTVAQQLQLSKSLKELKEGKEVQKNTPSSKPVILRCKRRVDFSGIGCKLVDSQNPSVSRRNERERKRVKMVNMGFETLRQHVPSGRKNKKMSKVETLKSAVQYIKQLQETLGVTDDAVDLLTSSIDMLENRDTEASDDNGNSTVRTEGDGTNQYQPGTPMSTVSEPIMSMSPAHSQGQLSPVSEVQYSPAQSHGQGQYSPVSSVDGHFTQLQNGPMHYSSAQTVQYSQHNYQQSDMYSQLQNGQAYSQQSPAGSLHSPTSSVMSDASYDSMAGDQGQEEDDLLNFTNWF